MEWFQVLAIVASLVGVLYVFDKKNDKKIDDFDKKNDKRIDDLIGANNKRIDSLDKRIDDLRDLFRSELKPINEKLDNHISDTNKKIDDLTKKVDSLLAQNK